MAAENISSVTGELALAAAPAETAAPAPLDAPAIVAAEPSAAPATESAIVAPDSEAAPAVDGAPVESPVEAAAEAEKPAEAPAAEVAPEKAAPVYAEFKMPEGIQAAPDQIEAFTGLLGKHGLTQEAGQELMDMHAASLKQASDQMAQRQLDVFNETRRDWREDFFKSAGNRSDTVANDAKWAISEIVKDTKARQALWDVLALTGAGDNKHVINAFAGVAKRLRERNAPPQGIPQNGTKSGNPAERRYGKPPA